MRCNAKNRKGEQCKRHAVPGKTKCRMHGGLTPSGIASPHFKTGRHSKYLPGDYAGAYKQSMKDPDLLNLRSEIALVDSRIINLLEALNKDSATKAWSEIKVTWQEFIENQRILNNAQATETQRTNAQGKVAMALRSMNEIIETGAHEQDTWDKLFEATEQRRRLTSSEAKRLSDMNQFITAEKAMALTYAVLDIVRRSIIGYRDAKKVTDNKLLNTISEEVRKLVAMPQQSLEAEVIDAE